MNKKKYPMFVSAYFLDFSYPGHFNLETRVFITLPLPGSSLIEGKIFEMFSFCLEMNSVFNKEGYFDTEHNLDLGLKVMLHSEELFVSDNFKKNNFLELIKVEDATSSEVNWFDSERDMYNRMEECLHEFLEKNYHANWMKFYIDKKEKYDDPFRKRVPLTDAEKTDTYNREKERVQQFIVEAKIRFELLTKTVTLSNDTLRKLNLQTNASEGEISNTVGNVNSLYNNKDLVSLTKISKTRQFYELNNETTTDLNKKSKPKKI